MKGLHRTVISGLIGGLAGSFLGAAAFVAVDALMPSTAEAQWHCAEASVVPLPRAVPGQAGESGLTI